MAYDLLSRNQTSSNWAINTTLGGSDEPLVWTRSAVEGELARIRGVLDTVNSEASQAALEGKITSDEWKQWHQTYLTGHKFVTSASNWWGSNVEVARGHEREALKWHELFAARGSTLQGPRNLGRDEDRITPKVLMALGGIAATAMLISAIKR